MVSEAYKELHRKDQKRALEKMADRRKIKAHKGGRTERVNARLTPEEKDRLNKVLGDQDLSLSDWIVKHLDRTIKNYK